MNLKAIEVEHNGKKFYLTQMQAKHLIDPDKIVADIWRKNNQTGYQREPIRSRSRGFMMYLKSRGAISPVSILLSVRKPIKFRPEGEKYGTLEIPTSEKFWIVDGQHRIDGLKMLIEQETSYGEVNMPVIIVPLDKQYQEAELFVIINKTHKGVKPDLAERFLSRVYEEHPDALLYLPSAIIKGFEWKPKALTIAEILNNEHEPWKGKIIFPNEPRGTGIVSQKSFTDSLEPILTDQLFLNYEATEITEMLRRYWLAIEELCPEAIENPKQHVIQRTTGVFVLHRLFPTVVSYCVDSEGNPEPLKQSVLKGKIKSMKSPKMDSKYWSVKEKAGIVGTSKKGIALLFEEIKKSFEAGNPMNRQHRLRHFRLD